MTMLAVKGDAGVVAAVVRALRDIPAAVVPYATSMALTAVARAAQKDVVAAMPRVFDRPTPYTLNATFVEPARKDRLTARVAVKDSGSSGGVAPEHYLLPEVLGGRRDEKRSERALRYAGVLAPGQRAVPARGAPLDAYGNLERSTYTSIRRALGAQKLGAQKGTRSASLFVLGRPGAYRGVFMRQGRNLQPLLVFTRAEPQYRQRLDFTGLAETAVTAAFGVEFDAALTKLLRNGSAWT